MELPKNLREVGITEQTHFEKMAEKAAAGCVGCFVPLSKEDIIEIFKAAF
jgi:alcohol dehydrogenase class IV